MPRKQKNRGAREHPCRLFYLLLQFIKQVAVKKFPQTELQTIAQLLDGHHPGVPAFLIQHTVNHGGRNARKRSRGVRRNIPAFRTAPKSAAPQLPLRSSLLPLSWNILQNHKLHGKIYFHRERPRKRSASRPFPLGD